MGDLKECMKQRANIRGRLTLFENFLKTLNEKNISESRNRAELSLRMNKIHQLSTAFDEIQINIENLDTDFEKQLKEREETENRFFSLLSQGQCLLELCHQQHSSESSSSRQNGCNIKLPTLNIPSFDGDSRKWLEFRDMYLALIHNNDSIEDISKFHYLKSYLVGAASAVINSVSVSSDNYGIAWTLLSERYNNKRILVNEHMKCLFNIEPLYKESDKGIRNLIDTISKNLSALQLLGEPTDQWNTIVIYMATLKLDTNTARNWEEYRSKIDTPTLDNFYTFLRDRATILETVFANRSIKTDKQQGLNKSKSFAVSSNDNNLSIKSCIACKQAHRLYECPTFKEMSSEDRNKQVYQWKLCVNCLRSGHMSFQCKTSGCRICKRKHNTLLHREKLNAENKVHTTLQTSTTTTTNKQNDLPSSDQKISGTPSSVSMSAVASNQALLSTALVKVTNNDITYVLRALLDSGSQTSFISESARKKIGCCTNKNNRQYVSGINNTTTIITEHCDIHIRSLHSNFSIPLRCYVLPNITGKIPHANLSYQELGIPYGIKLADPNFYEPSEIDLLLGAEVFWELIESGKLRLGPNKPMLHETQLGWIVAGPVGSHQQNKSTKIQSYFCQEIKDQLAKFWESEEIPTVETKPLEGNYCEDLFKKTTYRDANGRFVVQIPLRENSNVLGDSYSIAEKRFLQLERKMNRNEHFSKEYTKFIHEYESLGHMSEIPKPVFGCYLPHHAVMRESSETTKTRVVFDASAKTSSGKSFNDIQHVGPVVQDDLFSILLRFRQHKYVVSADVEKMYRQILIEPKQRHLQMILWRDDRSKPMKIFQLNTVTYGTASAPFLSTRCLLRLSNECPDEHISKLIKEDFYVDDFLSGASTENELKYVINSVTGILNSACLPLRKFRTNLPSAFENNANSIIPKDLNLSAQSSALGLQWDPVKDVFQFNVNIQPTKCITKRTILSNSAKLFDPLGLLSICTITPKIILQKLWLSKLDWDDSVSADLEKRWFNFISSLNALSIVEVPRLALCNDLPTLQLHSFSDASEAAYAACVYLRSVDSSGSIVVRLICAKTKVAPIKPVTIPRLELCGALLSARLSAKVIKALRCKVTCTYHWTDSSVVLGWLSTQARDLKTYVSNRVGKIQQLTSTSTWRHVPGAQNPADLASRGIEPHQINKTTLWWKGPPFLMEEQSQWPKNITPTGDVPEKRNVKSTTTHATCTTSTTTNTNSIIRLINFERYSRFSTMHRATAYVLRFIHNIKNKEGKKTGHLNVDELKASFNVILKQHQLECFASEIKSLKMKENLPCKSRVLSLNPFIDEEGLMRVGGRLENSSEPHNRKHPILLDSAHNLTKLLFKTEHLQLMHCGPQLLLSNIRNRFWPIRGKILARSTVNNCKRCRIIKAKSMNPLMGNLPAPRVTVNLPFSITGVDFAGPFFISDRKGRGCKITKAYLCLFVCLSTKALHLEVASDLSTNIFLLCLRRFISRRGKPSEIYCDNGTNFVGADNAINEFIKSNNEQISSVSANEGIIFKFSPAYSPHFGGLWEAGVKSAKFHMTRMLGDKHLTFEELSTLFTQIEAILNSRPLTPLSPDPSDLEPLTPGHFLIGKALTSLPSPSLTDVNPNRLDRYQLLEQLRQNFWDRWRNEYLSELQQRVKWRINQQGLQEGDMVVLKDPNLPPLKWRMGRISRLYPGPDNISRVAEIQTTKGVTRRAINRLCPLFTDS